MLEGTHDLACELAERIFEQTITIRNLLNRELRPFCMLFSISGDVHYLTLTDEVVELLPRLCRERHVIFSVVIVEAWLRIVSDGVDAAGVFSALRAGASLQDLGDSDEVILATLEHPCGTVVWRSIIEDHGSVQVAAPATRVEADSMALNPNQHNLTGLAPGGDLATKLLRSRHRMTDEMEAELEAMLREAVQGLTG